MAPRAPFQIRHRTVLAMTCRQCGQFKAGVEFPRYQRSFKDKIQYVSRRCRACWWSRMDRVNPKNGR